MRNRAREGAVPAQAVSRLDLQRLADAAGILLGFAGERAVGLQYQGQRFFQVGAGFSQRCSLGVDPRHFLHVSRPPFAALSINCCEHDENLNGIGGRRNRRLRVDAGTSAGGSGLESTNHRSFVRVAEQ